VTLVWQALTLVAAALVALVPSTHAPHGAAGARCSIFDGTTTCVWVER